MIQSSQNKEKIRRLISAASKKKRLDRGKNMLAMMNRATKKELICFDKNMFTVEAVHHKKNDRVYACNPVDLPKVTCAFRSLL